MMPVVQIFRKKNPAFFSIEKVFFQVQPWLQELVQLSFITFPFYNSGLLSIFRNLHFLTGQKNGKKIYHITGDVHYAALALPAARTILTIHDCVFLYAATGFKRTILKWLFLDMPVKRAAIVTTISEFTRQEIIRFTNCDSRKIIVIPNPSNDTIYFEEREFNQVKPTILFIGTTPNKNLERVAVALEGISCRLQILGKLTGAQQHVLQQHNIDFNTTSNVNEVQLANLYMNADIVLFPSTFEGFGLPILEAQKAGRVVVASNLEPMKTVAGQGGLLVDPFDTADLKQGIQKVIHDKELRNELIKNGFENVLQYQPETIARSYFRVYQKVAGNTASGKNK